MLERLDATRRITVVPILVDKKDMRFSLALMDRIGCVELMSLLG
jgi:hypothetical protein